MVSTIQLIMAVLEVLSALLDTLRELLLAVPEHIVDGYSRGPQEWSWPW